MELTWTTSPPSRGGFYWARLPETDRPQIVWTRNVDLPGKASLLLVFRVGMDAVYPPHRVVAWAGPIPEPLSMLELQEVAQP
jgi:hypothetical protein